MGGSPVPSRCGTAIEMVVLISMTHTSPINKKVLISWGGGGGDFLSTK